MIYKILIKVIKLKQGLKNVPENFKLEPYY